METQALSGIASEGFKLQIEAVQSATAFKVTDPRVVRRVSVVDLAESGLYQRCFNIILCYNKAEEHSGWHFAGWIKESLGRVFSEDPILCGRLRKGEDGGGDLEVVSNDSGARLVEVKVDATLEEFLKSKKREELEAKLVSWKDVDEQNPQFSPLFYIQVTNFECGGYSIGISCSLLLADPFLITNFLKRWSIIHNELTPQNDNPLFYSFNVRRTEASPSPSSINLNIGHGRKGGQTLFFKASTKNMKLDDKYFKTLALVCTKKTEDENMNKIASKISVMMKDSCGDLKEEKVVKDSEANSWNGLKSRVVQVNWESLGAHDVSFYKGNKPVYASHWMGSGGGDGFVMITPSREGGVSELNAFVTIPS